MTRLIPAEVVQPEAAADDPRIGRLLGSQLGVRDTPEVVMRGFPSDEGVRRNGSRVGAALGPAAIRSALYRLSPDARSPRFDELLSRTRDLGDVAVSGDVEMDQQRLGEVLKSSIEAEAPGVSAPDAGGAFQRSLDRSGVSGRPISGSFIGGHRRAEPGRRSGWTDGAPRRYDGVVAVARQVGAALDGTTCALFNGVAL